MKNKEIMQILKHADARTERIISEQFPANWDMESAFQRSYSNYLRQKETDPAESRRRLFRFTKTASSHTDTGFFLRRPAIAACLLLTLCTTGTIFYIQHRAEEPELSVTVQTESVPIAFTEVTVTVTTATQTKHTEAVTTLTQITAASSDRTTARTETGRNEPQTVPPGRQQTQESTPSDTAVLVPQAGPADGTSPGQQTVRPVTQTETRAPAATTTTQTQTQTVPPVQTTDVPETVDPAQPAGFYVEEIDNKHILRFRSDAAAGFSAMQFAVRADGFELTEISQNSWSQVFMLTAPGCRETLDVTRYSYNSDIYTYNPNIYQLSTQTRNERQICMICPADQLEPDSQVTIIWEQYQSVFSVTVAYADTEQIYLLMDHLEDIDPA